MPTGYDIVVRDKISRSIDRKLKDITTDALAAATALSTLNGIAGGNIFSKLNSGANSASGSIERLARNTQTLTQRFILAQGQAAKFAGNLQRSFVQIRSILSGALLLGATDRIVEQVDSYRNLQNRLRTVTSSEKQLAVTSNALFEIADKARAPIKDIAESYTRFDRAIAATGGSQKESIRLTETVSKLLTLSGTSATEAGASMLQLSQAFNKGKLDGDEFRSIAELMPRVLDEVSNVLGINRSQIYKWSRDGKINTEVLRTAFANLAKSVDTEMAKLPRTIGQAFTQLTNSITKFFGELDAKFGITDTVVSFLDYLRNNLPEIARLLKAAALGFAAFAAPVLLTAFGPILLFFASAPGLIGGTVAYLTYFGDSIKVTSDGLVTFTDVIDTAFRAIYEFAQTNLKIDTGSFLSDGGQQIVNNLYQGLVFVKDTLIEILSVSASIGGSLGELLFGTIPDGAGEYIPVYQKLFEESFTNIGISAKNVFIDIAVAIIETLAPVAVDLFNVLIEPFERMRESAAPILAGLGVDISKSFTLRDDKIDVGLVNRLKGQKSDKKSTAYDQIFSAGKFEYDQMFNYLNEKATSFESNWLRLATENAQKRKALEAKALDENTNPQDSLRGVDAGKEALEAQNRKLLEFDAALDKVIAKSRYLKDVFESKDPDGQDKYTDSFQLKVASQIPELAAFNQEIIKLGIGMTTVGSNTQSATTAVQGFGQAASSATNITSSLKTANSEIVKTPESVSQIGPAFEQAANSSQNFMSAMQTGLSSLNDQINQFADQARQAYGEIGGAFFDSLTDGKFDPKKFLGKALPAAAKAFLAKYNENRADQLSKGIKAGAPQDEQNQGGSIFDIGKIAQKSVPQLNAMNQQIKGINSSLNQTAQVPANVISNPPQQLQQDAAPDGSSLIGLQTSAAGLNQALSQVSSTISGIQGSIQSIAQSFDQVSQSATTFASAASTSIQSVGQVATQTGAQIQSGLEGAFTSATSASSSMASSVISDMNSIAAAAQSAASAVSSVGSSGGGGGGGFGGIFGFASGGYTGDVPTNRVAGFVHGQEFVMPANATAKYRPMLEAMRDGRAVGAANVPTGGGSGGSSFNVQIDNYGSSKIEVEQISATDIRIIAREESRRVMRRETGAVVSASLSNPNSKVSKSLSTNTQTRRRR